MTKPNKRRFQSVRVITVDPANKTEHIDLDPTLLSAADLEKICKSLDSIRATIMLEFARRAGYIRQEPVLWLEPTGRFIFDKSGNTNKNGTNTFRISGKGKGHITEINSKELEELAAEL